MNDTDHDRDHLAGLRDHIIERCARADLIAPSAWVEWFLRLEVAAIAARADVSAGEAARDMSLDDASLIADELIEVTRSSDR